MEVQEQVSKHLHYAKNNPCFSLGKNFVAKHIVESLYKEGYKSKYARLYVASRDFMHDDEDHLRQYKDRIKHDIEKATSGCEYSTFVFDEVDKMPLKLLEAILFYIDFHSPTYAQPIDFRKTIFIFLRFLNTKNHIFTLINFLIQNFSNTGGKEINTISLNYYFSSVSREDYNITEFQRALANAAFTERGWFLIRKKILYILLIFQADYGMHR